MGSRCTRHRCQATVSAKITGRVVDVQAFAQLAQQRATLEAASVALWNAEPTFARSREQFERQVTSAQEFDSVKATYDAVRMSADVAHRDGQGGAGRRNGFADLSRCGFTRTGIGSIVDMDSLEVGVDVSESFINRAKPDQDVTVMFNAYPDWKLPATAEGPHRVVGNSSAGAAGRRRFFAAGERHARADGRRLGGVNHGGHCLHQETA
jgi:multidrug resistance efflux pump